MATMTGRYAYVLLGALAPLAAATASAGDDHRICADDGRACLESTARLYLDALMSADDSKVPLAADVRRTHALGNGAPVNQGRTIVGEAAMRASIRAEKLTSRGPVRLFTDEERREVIALWESATATPAQRTITVMDRIRIDNGLIREVEVISAVREGATDAMAAPPTDPAAPLIAALAEVSTKLHSTPYASSSDVARRNTETYLAGLLTQAWGFAEQLNMIGTPYFSRGATVEGLPGLYNPDNLYRSALLEPGGAYRIYGRRGSHADLSFQIIDQYPIVGLGKNLMVVRPDDLWGEPGEDFEFYLGGAPRAGARWFAMPDNAVAVLSRQSFGDWHETPTSLFIERLDMPAPHGDRRPFAQAANALRKATALWVDGYVPEIERHTPVNSLPAPRPSATDAGGLGGQMSVMARYRIQKGEALLISVRKADAAYQGIQLGDPWFVTPNTVEHQVSLTARQAHVDDDGVIRFVISLDDPGVPNWLDPAGNPEGYIFMRWQNIRTPLTDRDAPAARLIRLASLRQALPASTPVVSTIERRKQVAERKWAPQVR
ncbi:hypothetical protein SAMN06295912_1535 [Sphingomonas laterariae]|uniref:DUF8021 domain-containing protein n=1 Tax=Edaphosphingomonas laterariae TaxID=861865 RepID=A0A239KJC9_9SPHN|nr:hypothetical protein [Sphingomonas laterariae]SNT17812.1 hypothetical protein SAMN06295912_1535 [Sphingomonas laterariae]